METTYIAHHGIEGQKWGKRNSPPYPLKESAKSYAEKKEAKEDTKAARKKKAATIAGLVSLGTSTAIVGHAFVTASLAAGTLTMPITSVPAAIGVGINWTSKIIAAMAED